MSLRSRLAGRTPAGREAAWERSRLDLLRSDALVRISIVERLVLHTLEVALTLRGDGFDGTVSELADLASLLTSPAASS